MDDSQHATVMYGGNAAFVEALYEAYLADPASVDSDWRAYFDEVRAGAPETAHSAVVQRFYELGRRRLRAAPSRAEGGENLSAAQQTASALVNAYRVYGHISADKNPLHIRKPAEVPELTPEYYGLSVQDLGTAVKEGPFSGTLQEIIDQLRQSYCGSIGFEFTYLPAPEREWFQQRIESVKGRGHYTPEQKKRIYAKLNAAEGLEKYLHQRYVGQKRFSLEGGESFIPLMDALIQGGGQIGIKETVIGMAHRGRLNVLGQYLRQETCRPLLTSSRARKSSPTTRTWPATSSTTWAFPATCVLGGGPMHLALAFNPSHLEIVSPVVHGSVRARQDRPQRRRAQDRSCRSPFTATPPSRGRAW